MKGQLEEIFKRTDKLINNNKYSLDLAFFKNLGHFYEHIVIYPFISFFCFFSGYIVSVSYGKASKQFLEHSTKNHIVPVIS